MSKVDLAELLTPENVKAIMDNSEKLRGVFESDEENRSIPMPSDCCCPMCVKMCFLSLFNCIDVNNAACKSLWAPQCSKELKE